MKYLFHDSYSGRYHRAKFYKGAKICFENIGEVLVLALVFGVVFVALSILN